MVKVVSDEESTEQSENFNFSASIAAFGMILRDSEYKGNASFDMVLALAEKGKGNDEKRYRSEFIDLVNMTESISSVVNK